MSQITTETLFHQITSLPFSEKVKLRALLDDQLQNPDVETEGVRLVKPIPVPDPEPSMRWMNEHSHEYDGQWVALDGANADEVFAIADADGAYLPLVTYIPHADAAPFVRV